MQIKSRTCKNYKIRWVEIAPKIPIVPVHVEEQLTGYAREAMLDTNTDSALCCLHDIRLQGQEGTARLQATDEERCTMWKKAAVVDKVDFRLNRIRVKITANKGFIRKRPHSRTVCMVHETKTGRTGRNKCAWGIPTSLFKIEFIAVKYA